MSIPFSWDLVAGLISFLFTLMVLSYLIGDNPAFRVAVYLFIGVTAGYIAAIAWNQVLKPHLFQPLWQGGWTNLLLIVPLVLGLLLLAKLSPRVAWLGSPSLALIVGVGAAVMIGGTVLGTLFPQAEAAASRFDLPPIADGFLGWLGKFGEALLMLIGTISTLVFFQFSTRKTLGSTGRGRLFSILARVGQVFVAITFGVLFAGALAAAMTALVERMDFLVHFFGTFR